MAYQVTAPLVIVKDKGGVMHHVYQGGLLPENADEKHVKQLLADKMVEKAKVADQPTESKTEGAPQGNASREAWAEFAKGKGASEDELKDPAEGGLSRDDLREKYGK
jgi:hypothetical protein